MHPPPNGSVSAADNPPPVGCQGAGRSVNQGLFVCCKSVLGGCSPRSTWSDEPDGCSQILELAPRELTAE